jgi:LPS biosynthesis protein
MIDNIEKLRKIQLMMLEDIIRICSENNIMYYMFHGSLLGTIRHSGFIPWDDDVDICMYREDIMKLKKIITERYSEKYFIQDVHTEKEYTRYITKVRLNNTLQMEVGNAKSNMHHGIYLDIFPLDHIHKTHGLGISFRGYMVSLLMKYLVVRHSKSRNTILIRKILINLLKPLSYLIPYKSVNKLLDYMCSMDNNKDSKYTTCFVSEYGYKKQIVENEVYGEGVFMNFENLKVRVPTQYDKILNKLYGDYMTLPPVEKRVHRHNVIKYDLGNYEDHD